MELAALIRAVVVDDSSVFRMAVSRALRTFPDVEVLGTCRNGKEALDAIAEQAPNLVTMDFEMPVMDGMQALREIVKRNAGLPADRRSRVVMLSAHSKDGADVTIEALGAGAFDFIAKQDGGGSPEDNFERMRSDLGRIIDTMRHELAVARPGSQAASPPKVAPRSAVPSPRPTPVAASNPHPTLVAPPSPAFRGPVAKPRAIFIGVSTGGPMALSTMLPELSRLVSLPIFIVQHMPPKFTQSLAESLDRKCRHKVVEAAAGMVVSPDTIYIAPGGFHMEVVKGNGGMMIATQTNPPENGCRPAVDVLFRSAVTSYDGHVCAVVLTGMGSDGTLGLKGLRERGAPVLVQDKETSVVWGMPGSAFQAGLVDHVLPLGEIPAAVVRCL